MRNLNKSNEIVTLTSIKNKHVNFRCSKIARYYDPNLKNKSYLPAISVDVNQYVNHFLYIKVVCHIKNSAQ